MLDFLRRTWAQINLDALDNNIEQIKSVLRPGTGLCAVVKADCYGHGYAYTAQQMQESGADRFAVSNLAEALQLRVRKIAEQQFPLVLLFQLQQVIHGLIPQHFFTKGVETVRHALTGDIRHRYHPLSVGE